MALTLGSQLGPYRILALVGTGAMGAVYRARDSRLERDVAIKVLPEELAADADRRARLEREARVLAALNHPNIATIHGVEESSDTLALVMELIDGETLEERILRAGRGSSPALPGATALGIARQMVDALEAAHDRGIVHRDLKPANVKVTSGDIVKVLDFGLAKPMSALLAGAGPTLVADGTRAGTVLGTPAYMSPEQARGEAADARADIWAFGCVLYELLTGLRAFRGYSAAETFAHVLEREPDLAALPATTPASVRRLLRRCLEKDPKRRLRHIGDARFELDEAANDAPASDASANARLPASARAAAMRAAAWAAGGLFVGGLATAFALRLASEPPATATTHFSIALPAHFNLGTLALSPDGRTLVYDGDDHTGARLYRRALDALEPEPIRGTEDGHGAFFSPDGTSIGFWVGRTLKTVPLEGGIARTLYQAPSTGLYGTWVSDDEVVFNADDSGLMLLSLRSGATRTLTALDAEREAEHRAPAAVPGHRAVLFTSHYGAQDAQGVQVLSLATGEYRELIQGNGARFVPPDRLLFQRGGSLWAAPFDVQRLELTGAPAEIVRDVAIYADWQPIVAVAADGTLAYARGGEPYPPRSFVWVDEAGRETSIDAPARAWWWPQLSADGRRIGAHIMDPLNMDAWIYELDHGPLVRVTYHALQDGHPVWSPDGTQFAFWSRQAGGPGNIYARSADLSGQDRRIAASDTAMVPAGWTPDGRDIVFQRESPETGIDIGLVAADAASPPALLIAGRANEAKPAVSPDGRWIAYDSDMTGRRDVYVRPFPKLDGQWQVSTDGGTAPLWNADGSALYFRRGNAVLKVPVDAAGGTFRHGNPELLFEGDYVREEFGVYDVPYYAFARDTGRFLMMKQESVAPREIVVIVNWARELRRRASR